MPKGRERTLTAAVAPFSSPESRSVPALLPAGRADDLRAARGRRPVILDRELEIGRGPGGGAGPARLGLDDPLVSGRHARLTRGEVGFRLEDLGSKNGTFLDGARLAAGEAAPLGDGARVFAGHHAFVFRLLSTFELEALDEERRGSLGPVETLSPALAVLAHKLRRLAPTGTEVLLVGETGVGKEVYARALHAASGRIGPFVPVNCAALPRELVESELFGFQPGAHSTARAPKRGLLEEAEGGTLLLDEIGEMPPEAQSKLLRFLQDREILSLGQTRPRRLDVRVLAATASAAAAGLRDDLLARLGAAPIALPPLRDRPEDIGALAAHFLGEAGGARALEVPAFRALCLHRWPLNVRELQKALASASALAGGRAIGLRDLPEPVARALDRPPAAPAREPRAAGERKAPAPGPSPAELEALLARHEGRVADVARALGRQRAAVWRWIKRFGLAPERHRGPR
jgi:DNA-binding NtrC family response regulator